MKHNLLLAFVLLISTVITSCKKDTLFTGTRGELIEQQSVASISAYEVPSYIDEFDAQALAFLDVEAIRLVYHTEFEGKGIQASGLLLMPKNSDSTYLMMYCHGTLVPSKLLGSRKSTPSYYNGSKDNFFEVRNVGLAFATQGYAVFIPDYIGYGTTENKEHPYILFGEQFKSNIDGMLAAKKVLQEKGKLFTNRLFIAGWSQGAGCAISAHRFTQEQYSADFTMIASSGYAGPYDFEKFADEILQSPNKAADVMPLFCWYAYVMNRYEGLNRPTDQMFTFPVYDQFSAVLAPSNVPSEILQDYLIAGLRDKSDEAIMSRLRANSFHSGWLPQGKVFLHHGKEDKMIPYVNSTSAYENLTAEGGDITLYGYDDGDHFNVLKNFVQTTITDFNALR